MQELYKLVNSFPWPASQSGKAYDEAGMHLAAKSAEALELTNDADMLADVDLLTEVMGRVVVGDFVAANGSGD
jgi:hypothetical protein